MYLTLMQLQEKNAYIPDNDEQIKAMTSKVSMTVLITLYAASFMSVSFVHCPNV